MKLYDVIDISEYQKSIDPSKLNARGVILRLGYTGYGSNRPALDKKFEEFYEKLHEAGIPVGVYYFTLAHTPEMVKMETDFVLSHIKSKKIEFPIYIDVESQGHSEGWTNLPKSKRSELVAAWCEQIESAGYYSGIYANLDWLKNKLDANVIKPYDKWIAQYYQRCTYSGEYGMWQRTSSESGEKHGVGSKNVDLSECYVDYPTVIKNARLNFLDPGQTEPPIPTKKPEEPKVEDEYTIEQFRADACKILGAANCKDALAKSITVSTAFHKHHAIVTPLERYMKAIGYYKGEIEADVKKTPNYGRGMAAAIKKYQEEVVKSRAYDCDGIITKGKQTWKKLLGV